MFYPSERFYLDSYATVTYQNSNSFTPLTQIFPSERPYIRSKSVDYSVTRPAKVDHQSPIFKFQLDGSKFPEIHACLIKTEKSEPIVDFSFNYGVTDIDKIGRRLAKLKIIEYKELDFFTVLLRAETENIYAKVVKNLLEKQRLEKEQLERKHTIELTNLVSRYKLDDLSFVPKRRVCFSDEDSVFSDQSHVEKSEEKTSNSFPT